MPYVTTLTVTNTSRDYFEPSGSDGSTAPFTIKAEKNNSVFPVRSFNIWFQPDTSGIPANAVVVGLKLRLYEYAYNASRGVAKEYKVRIYESGTTLRATETFTYLGSGFNRVLTLPASFYPYVINQTNDWAWVRITVDDPGGTDFRVFFVQDSSYGSSREMQLEVTYRLDEQTHVAIIGA